MPLPALLIPIGAGIAKVGGVIGAKVGIGAAVKGGAAVTAKVITAKAATGAVAKGVASVGIKKGFMGSCKALMGTAKTQLGRGTTKLAGKLGSKAGKAGVSGKNIAAGTKAFAKMEKGASIANAAKSGTLTGKQALGYIGQQTVQGAGNLAMGTLKGTGKVVKAATHTKNGFSAKKTALVASGALVGKGGADNLLGKDRSETAVLGTLSNVGHGAVGAMRSQHTATDALAMTAKDVGSDVGKATKTAVDTAGGIVKGATKSLLPDGFNLGTMLKVGGLGLAGVLGIPKIIGAIGDAKDKKAAKELNDHAAANAPQSGGSDMSEVVEMIKMQMMTQMAQQNAASAGGGQPKPADTNFVYESQFQDKNKVPK